MPIRQIKNRLWNKKLLWIKPPPTKYLKTNKMDYFDGRKAFSNHLYNIFLQLRIFPNLGLRQSFSFTPFSFRLSLLMRKYFSTEKYSPEYPSLPLLPISWAGAEIQIWACFTQNLKEVPSRQRIPSDLKFSSIAGALLGWNALQGSIEILAHRHPISETLPVAFPCVKCSLLL